MQPMNEYMLSIFIVRKSKWLCGWTVMRWLLRHILWLLILSSLLFVQRVYWRRWQWEILAVYWHRKRDQCVQARRYVVWNQSYYFSYKGVCLFKDIWLLQMLKIWCVLQSLCAHTTTWSLRRPASSSLIFKLISSNLLWPYGPILQLFMHPSR